VTPAVSVCIPTYNYARFLGRAIDSVLAQEYRDFELIVVDNASEDDTPAVLARYADRIEAHRNERNLGLFGNFARCLELARGEHVKFLAADDWLHPKYLGEAVALLDAHPTAAIASGPGWLVDEGGRVFGVGTTGVFAPGLVARGDALRAQADLLNVVGMPSNTLLRRAAVAEAGGFDARFAPAADVHLWGKLLARHDLAWMARPRCYLRIHRTKAHDYGLDPSESTFLAWEALGRETGLSADLVARALDAEAERSLLHAAASVLAGRPAAAARILGFTGRHVRWPRALGRFAVRLPVHARAQAARVAALRAGRLVVYGPLPRRGPRLGDDGAPLA
jgi:glycosyltransferase involved in cell wall biosynthesis